MKPIKLMELTYGCNSCRFNKINHIPSCPAGECEMIDPEEYCILFDKVIPFTGKETPSRVIDCTLNIKVYASEKELE